jgi:hypothetical protein
MFNKINSVIPYILATGAITISSSLLATIPAQAFTVQFGANSTSSNNPPTGASADVEFTFTNLGAGLVQLNLSLTNTTGLIPIIKLRSLINL